MLDRQASIYHGYNVAGVWDEAPAIIVRRLTRSAGTTPIPRSLPGYRFALSLANNDAWLSIGRRVCTRGPFPLGASVLGQPGDDFDGEMRGPADVLLVLMDPSCVGERLAAMGVPRGAGELRDIPAREDVGLRDLACRFASAIEDDVPRDALYYSTLRTALTERILIRHAARRVEGIGYRETLAPARLRRLIDFVETHLGSEMRIAHLAEVVGLSPAHLARAFRNAMGMPLHRYVLQRRLERVRKRVRRGDGSMAELARSSGFCDASHLSKAYRRAFGAGQTVCGEQKSA
jgi:AraC-like DNA-binding protein